MEAYLDNASTTRVSERAAKAAYRAMVSTYGNPSSSHSVGMEAKRLLEESRGMIAKTIHAEPSEIYFTSGGTESDNWAVRSGAGSARRRGKHIISSNVEHEAILKSLEELKGDGFEVTLLNPSELTSQGVMNALRDDTIFVTLMLVNNETGAITDIQAISKALRKAGSKAIIHTDAVQAYLKLPIDARKLGADMISVSAHKIHGPKGIGALYVKKGIKLSPMIVGGGQESGQRSGTEALPQIAGFATAVEEGFGLMDVGTAGMTSNRSHAVERLLTENPGLVVNGGGSPHILNISLPGYKSEVLMNYLNARGVCVSKGSACKKGARSHVLQAMGLPNEVIDGALRVSLSRYTQREEIDYFCDVLKEARENIVTARR